MKNWCFSWFPMDAMKVTLKDGSFHAVDSDALSFEVVLKWHYRNAIEQAVPYS